MKKFLFFSKKSVKAIIRRSIAFVDARQDVKSKLTLVFHRFGLYGFVRSIYRRFTSSSFVYTDKCVPKDVAHLSPRARKIYKNLKAISEGRLLMEQR